MGYVYKSIDVCVECETKLTHHQKMYSNATCPHCGNTVNGTVVDSKKMVVKIIYNYPKWHFWKLLSKQPRITVVEQFDVKVDE